VTASRVFLLVIILVSAPLAAGAQFGGMPGLPGGPPGQVPGLGSPPGSPRVCQELSELRDQTQKHGLAIQKANERKATVQDACKLFKTFLAAETQFIRGLEDNSRTCGVPPDAIKQAREGHAKASQVGKQVCDAAAQGPRPGGLTGYFWWPSELEQTGDFGGMPDVPRGLPAPDVAGSSGPPAALPPVCRELLTLREETNRHEQAIQRATERRAPVQVACRLVREGAAVQTKFLKGLEEHGGTCGTPADELKLVKERHAWALWIGDFCGKSGDMRMPSEGFYKR
jgi:hypothetical protein